MSFTGCHFFVILVPSGYFVCELVSCFFGQRSLFYSITAAWHTAYKISERSQSSALSQTFLMQVIQVRNETCFNFSPKSLSVEEVELQEANHVTK